MTETQIRKMEQRCLHYSAKLEDALDVLSIAATKALGYKVVADICGGMEIEFRKLDGHGAVDDNSCIRIEQVISTMYNKQSKQKI